MPFAGCVDLPLQQRTGHGTTRMALRNDNTEFLPQTIDRSAFGEVFHKRRLGLIMAC